MSTERNTFFDKYLNGDYYDFKDVNYKMIKKILLK